jgi:hypothetical protein
VSLKVAFSGITTVVVFLESGAFGIWYRGTKVQEVAFSGFEPVGSKAKN